MCRRPLYVLGVDAGRCWTTAPARQLELSGIPQAEVALQTLTQSRQGGLDDRPLAACPICTTVSATLCAYSASSEGSRSIIILQSKSALDNSCIETKKWESLSPAERFKIFNTHTNAYTEVLTRNLQFVNQFLPASIIALIFTKSAEVQMLLPVALLLLQQVLYWLYINRCDSPGICAATA